jgi:hypothetical protein
VPPGDFQGERVAGNWECPLGFHGRLCKEGKESEEGPWKKSTAPGVEIVEFESLN